MKHGLLLSMTLLGLTACQTAPEATQPLEDGPYTFAVRFAERLDRTGGSLYVEVSGKHIKLTSQPGSSVFPVGVVEEGELFWHSSGKWIIVKAEADTKATAVGGCSGGPSVVDLKDRVYWTC